MTDQIIHVNAARYLRDYVLGVDFDDGTSKAVDVTPLLTGPMFEPLKSGEVFRRFTVDPISRTIVWPNGADLAPEALYALPAIEQVA